MSKQKKMYELVPGCVMKSLSLPYGQPSEDLVGYVEKDEYEGVSCHNSSICEVGWDPSVSPVHIEFDPLALHRIRASGITPVKADLAWWLQKLTRAEQFVSDGNAGTIAIPEKRRQAIDAAKLGNKKFIIYWSYFIYHCQSGQPIFCTSFLRKGYERIPISIINLRA